MALKTCSKSARKVHRKEPQKAFQKVLKKWFKKCAKKCSKSDSKNVSKRWSFFRDKHFLECSHWAQWLHSKKRSKNEKRSTWKTKKKKNWKQSAQKMKNDQPRKCKKIENIKWAQKPKPEKNPYRAGRRKTSRTYRRRTQYGSLSKSRSPPRPRITMFRKAFGPKSIWTCGTILCPLFQFSQFVFRNIVMRGRGGDLLLDKEPYCVRLR